MSQKRDHRVTGESMWPGKGARRHGGVQQPTKAGVTTRFYGLFYQESEEVFAQSCGERHPLLILLQSNQSARGTDNGARRHDNNNSNEDMNICNRMNH